MINSFSIRTCQRRKLLFASKFLSNEYVLQTVLKHSTYCDCLKFLVYRFVRLEYNQQRG